MLRKFPRIPFVEFSFSKFASMQPETLLKSNSPNYVLHLLELFLSFLQTYIAKQWNIVFDCKGIYMKQYLEENALDLLSYKNIIQDAHASAFVTAVI